MSATWSRGDGSTEELRPSSNVNEFVRRDKVFLAIIAIGLLVLLIRFAWVQVIQPTTSIQAQPPVKAASIRTSTPQQDWVKWAKRKLRRAKAKIDSFF